ncbi:molybdate ABC transporter substrate-binding protein [Caulobacter vibrioides]|uniref:molybdate ABC transporter substrate-binding protein n=1 Tax=Caulobacter vibrioides TaxID=155892 RepID=UPI000BB4AB9E|nr:molybdate ABC transporter substrate-binding protein [Caulobacter vibrioides]ATC23330.1 molybdate ABC transporter substrate-binding protein [Caulobacter vibrioides]AZH11542.1 molybdate ABC transporter substrate-binding protein [Caulobacter vibrioides]PLR12998.1 molybdate ABC transporter substrate-binding protein [Caulobacter vibrioides]
MIARRSTLIAVLTGLWSLAVAGAALAGETKVAVAANFTEPAKAITARFKARTGHDAVLSFGSSGQFYTQIANGAPYEVFLSADVERPQKAEATGLTVPGTRFTYATGRLVLFSRTPGLVDGQGAVLASGRFDKLAIADPKAAPYGQAAIETLNKLKRYDAVRPKIVMGASITQAFQFVQTGAAELGFVALSQVVDDKGGSRWIVPVANHRPIEQQAVLLKTGANSDAARAFLTFLKSAEAKAIIRRYGYEAR